MPVEIRRKDLKTLVAQGRAQLIEVLPASEYKKEHLPQAINIPLGNLTAEATKPLRKDMAVIVYCAQFALRCVSLPPHSPQGQRMATHCNEWQ